MRFLYLLLLLFISCKARPVKKKYTGPCKPFSVEELRSCKLRYNAEFIVMLNVHLFKEKEDFEELFIASPEIDFSNYAVGAILVDNKVTVLGNGEPALHDINLTLQVDSSYMKNCEVTVPFLVTRVDTIPPDGYKKKFFLFKVPKDAGIVKVNLPHKQGTQSWSFKMD